MQDANAQPLEQRQLDLRLPAQRGVEANLRVVVTAGCIDTGLPAGRRNFGQSVKTLIETANVHHARWVMFTETRCHFLRLMMDRLLTTNIGRPRVQRDFGVISGAKQKLN